MATILEFRRTAEPAPRVMELKDHAFGQIIIFPGVRIERRAYEGTPGGTAGGNAASTNIDRNLNRRRPPHTPAA